MKYPEEVKITNFSTMANAYRNINREPVDKLFEEKQSLEEKLQRVPKVRKNKSNLSKVKGIQKANSNLQEKIDKLDYKARQLWREIVTNANQL